MKSRLALIAVLLLLALPPASAAAKGPEEDVDIVASGDMSSWSYSPATITIPAGTTVTWHNTGSQAHSVTSRDHLFDSRLLDEDDEWSYTFNTPGTYRYFCVPFPFMKGTIVVTASADGPSSSRSTAGSSSANGGSSSGSSGPAGSSGSGGSDTVSP